jgi:eukaryotic-like serine/threonine-protein kinase
MDPLAHLQTALSERYRVEKLIGVGGMATVYLARDLRHDRNVALKLLKPELGAVLGVERFLSEIRVTANLQHPHLLPLFDSGEADGLLYYVMPYVEGESLRGRLDREKQLPVSEALRIAVAVAGALDYAHRHNVVHRDLKPENILLQDGQPVVSDFGIALAVTNAGGTRVTQTGLSLGTPQYMSPEQATGDRVIDARSDIYSLAAVLYEMLTGEPPHTGATVQAIIARVLTDRVRSVRASREMVPENVDAAIQRGLAKLPADRFATAKEFAEALQDPRFTLPVAATTTGVATVSSPASVGRGRAAKLVPWVIAAASLAVAGISLATRTRGADENQVPPARFGLTLPDSLTFRGQGGDLAISRDGSRLVVLVRRAGVQRLAVRSLHDTEMRVLEGTENAARPFFSPDGETIGFVVDGRIRTISFAGGGVATLVASGVGGFATWTDNGIVFVAQRLLMRVSANGGQASPVTATDSTRDFFAPSTAPDGQIVCMTAQNAGQPEIAIVDANGKVTGLGVYGYLPQWVESGHVLYNTAEGNLMAVPVAGRRLSRSGDPVLIENGIRILPNGVGIWRASANGTIIAARDDQASGGVLVTVDRSGRFTRLSDHVRRYRLPRVSRDGNRIAIQVGSRGTNADSDIWILDRRTGALSRFTTATGASDPLWSPDGKRIAFAGPTQRDSSPRAGGAADILWQPVDRSSPPELLYSNPNPQWPWSFTPDGQTLVFDEGPNPTRIRALDVRTGEARDVVANEFVNRLAKLSRDGRWLAYVSNESGRTEVYVRPFPGPGGAELVSVEGGDQPLWSRDGSELFYRDGSSMIAASMKSGIATSRKVLFEDTFDMSNATNYDVLPDGQFVMLRGNSDAQKLEVLVNWLPEIRRRAARPDR